MQVILKEMGISVSLGKGKHMIGAVNSNNGLGNIHSNASPLSGMKSKALENQLESQQQRLNKISGDSQMTEQDKIKERQKIQQEIAELNRKLRMEKLKEEEEEQKAEREQNSRMVSEEKAPVERTSKDKEKEESEVQDEKKELFKEIAPETVYQMMSANSDVQMERVLGNVERRKDGAENVLESEIELDRIRGTENPTKKEQLSEMRREKPLQMEILEVAQDTDVLGNNSNRKIIIREK